uniref:Putative sulfotransferase salivary gland overexpressed n=1 Tax=Rhipicephalus microplus TaxID=6941 RepID=A0A6M2CT83_RHIMP
MDEELYKDFDGLPLLDLYNQESLRSAKNYKPRRGDIILVSYPKSGSNWTQFIIWNIMTRGQQPKDIMELGLMSPFLEVTGATVVEDSCRTGPIATHFPYNVFPPVDQAKYVYVARNPYDCAVSMHHFLKGLTPKTYMDVSFDKFLRLFLSGKAFYGDYFDHVLPWYEHRHQPNILFITYEQLQADTKGMVLKIAHFLGPEHAATCRDDTVVQKILRNCSMESMRAILKENVSARSKKIAEKVSEKYLQRHDMTDKTPEGNTEMHEGGQFVRKGLVGEWKEYFTIEQIARTKKWITERTQGSDVMSLWEDLRLP